MPPKAVEKKCPEGKIRNPETGRCVKIDGAIGKAILAGKPLPKRKNAPKKGSSKSPPKSPPKSKGSSKGSSVPWTAKTLKEASDAAGNVLLLDSKKRIWAASVESYNLQVWTAEIDMSFDNIDDLVKAINKRKLYGL